MEQLLQAERLARLDSLAESPDLEVREQSRAVALFIKHLLGTVKDYVCSMDDAVRNPASENNPDYMDYDSESASQGSNGSGSVPEGT
jgi:hypothetical protein